MEKLVYKYLQHHVHSHQKLGPGLCSRVPALQVQSSEIKPSTTPKKKNTTADCARWYTSVVQLLRRLR
jgi:hypothetical protein